MKVVVVGGGFAGLAAAIYLQERRHEVTLLERRGLLGGRATSYKDAVTGSEVDNGTHLMVGAYHETFDLLRRAGALDLLLVQDDLRIDYIDEKGYSSLKCPPLPAPLHLLFGLLRLRVPWSVRWQAARLALAIRLGAAPKDLTLAQYFEKTGQGKEARALLWDGLSTAILNETPERAAAVLFYNVYREAFLKRRQDSVLVFARRGLGEIGWRLGSYFESRGGTVIRAGRANAVEIRDGAAVGVSYNQRPRVREAIAAGERGTTEAIAAGAVILATPWNTVPDLVGPEWSDKPPFAGLKQIRSSPIVSVELWLDRIVTDRLMVGLRNCEVEWVFDKGRLHGRTSTPQQLSFVVSAAYRTNPRPNAEIIATAIEALHQYFPETLRANVVRALVLREPDATFSCDPASEALRPGPVTPIRGLFLAGDWTDTGLPATIEGAVRSGRRVAETVHSSE